MNDRRAYLITALHFDPAGQRVQTNQVGNRLLTVGKNDLAAQAAAIGKKEKALAVPIDALAAVHRREANLGGQAHFVRARDPIAVLREIDDELLALTVEERAISQLACRRGEAERRGAHLAVLQPLGKV